MAGDVGWYHLLTAQAGPGSLYRFRIDEDLLVPDPVSRCQAEDIHGPSVVIDPQAFQWQDASWQGRPWEEAIIYELHSFCDFAKKSCLIDPINSRGKHLQAWLKVLRPTISRSRLRQHQYAVKSFFAFLHKLGVIKKNPAEALPYLKKKKSKKIQPISANEAFRLLAAVDRSNWYGKRNHLMFAILWCLGLRISELTGLQIKSFEPEHVPGKRIGLLRVRGKNKKQHALFVVDTLYDEFCSYLKDPQSPKGKDKPLFPV